MYKVWYVTCVHEWILIFIWKWLVNKRNIVCNNCLQCQRFCSFILGRIWVVLKSGFFSQVTTFVFHIGELFIENKTKIYLFYNNWQTRRMLERRGHWCGGSQSTGENPHVQADHTLSHTTTVDHGDRTPISERGEFSTALLERRALKSWIVATIFRLYHSP